jgi:hypothetical protein
VRFVNDLGEECAPTQGQAFFYYGRNWELFGAHFANFGAIMELIGNEV